MQPISRAASPHVARASDNPITLFEPSGVVPALSLAVHWSGVALPLSLLVLALFAAQTLMWGDEVAPSLQVGSLPVAAGTILFLAADNWIQVALGGVKLSNKSEELANIGSVSLEAALPTGADKPAQLKGVKVNGPAPRLAFIKNETPPLFRARLEIRLDEDLNGLLAGVHFDADRRIAEIHFVSTTVLSTDYGVRHLRFPPD